ncbi:MAG: hypothetical protein A2045_09545 [Rhodocyclales bacterium GWA2_65_20]|nr:MAG: hypothetical protein A2045_09545 [Rhodocyclales bacterium GWA2_65_20]
MSANTLRRILLIEDDPDEAALIVEIHKRGKAENPLEVVNDGVAALAYLRQEGAYAGRPLPGLILLDLNLPRMSGCELLAAIKADPRFMHIPVVVLTGSTAEHDVQQAYLLQASCFIAKPTDFDEFAEIVRRIEAFWLSATVSLP